MISLDCSSSSVQMCCPVVAFPKPIQPMQIRDTFKFELPNFEYFIQSPHLFLANLNPLLINASSGVCEERKADLICLIQRNQSVISRANTIFFAVIQYQVYTVKIFPLFSKVFVHSVSIFKINSSLINCNWIK